MDQITIEDSLVRVRAPEGQQASMPLSAFLQRLAPHRLDTGRLILPDGVKAVQSRGQVTVWVHETPPRVFRFRWIAARSRAPFGRGAAYREVTIALPYLVVLAVFGPGREQPFHLSGFNECFFRTDPLESLDDELCYPALLNCSRFSIPEGHPLAWICTQHLNAAGFLSETDPNCSMRRGLQALMHCLLETGFNYSSEHHEGSSWFSESGRVDSRIATVEAWEQATAVDPFFALDVPWLKTGRTVTEVIERIYSVHNAGNPTIRNSADLSRLVFHHGTPNSTR